MCNKKLEFYIAPNGCDRNNGSIKEPFKSFEQALDVIKAVEDSVEHITFWIREGVYRLIQPLVLEAEWISPFLQICFKSYKGEKVIVSGGVVFDTSWEDYDEHIKVARIGKGYQFDTLLANGKPQVLCRYPNYIEDEILNGYSEKALSRERVAKWKDPKGGYIRALHDRDWGGNSYIIKGKTQDNELIYQWVGDNNRGDGHSQNKVLVENIFEELDTEREWYYDADTGELFFYPPDYMDLKETIFEGAQLEELIIIRGISVDKPVTNIMLHGIQFTTTHRTLFTRTYERPLRGDWGIARAAAIRMENAENITITKCQFDNLGGNAIMMSGYNKDHVIDQNEFTNIGATGVLIVGLQKATRDASTWDHDCHKTIISDYQVGPKTEDYPRNITVSNNYIYNSGIYEKQSAGVCISIAEFIKVSKNTIHHVPRAAINISDGTFGGHVIEGNDMFDCVRETGDHGPFNSWGRDRFWSLNEYDTNGYYGKEKYPVALLDARSTVIIRNNRIHANHAFGIDLDDGSSNYEIYNNLCLGVGIKTREGFWRKVYNNILIGCCFEVHCTFAMNNDQFYNNIVYNNKAYNFIAINEGSTTEFRANVYWSDDGIVSEIDVTEKDCLMGKPEFKNTLTNDYTVSEASQALKLGFTNFSMKDKDFGREDKPNPPIYTYVHKKADDNCYELEGAKLTNITDDGCLSATGLPDYKGCYMIDLPSVGTWAEQGFRKYDVIRKVNQKQVIDAQDFIKFYEEVENNSLYEVELYRNQKPYNLKVIKKV